MTTGNNNENPYGDYVPGQYSASGNNDGQPNSTSQAGSQAATGSNPTDYSTNTPSYNGAQQQAYNQPATDYSQGYQQPTYGANGYTTYQQPKPKGLAIAALVLGILAFLSGWMLIGGIFGLVGLILGIVALVKANKGQADGKGMAITGIVLSILGLLAAIVVGILFGWAGGAALECADYSNDQVALEQCINQQMGISTSDN